MKMSVREARAQFATALAAVEKGERVLITKNGEPVAELGPPPQPEHKPFDWERLDQVRKEMGLNRLDGQPLGDEWLQAFNDPAWTREIFGPEYFDDEPPAGPAT